MDLPIVIESPALCADAPQLAAAVEEGVRFALSRGVTVRVEMAKVTRGLEARASIGLPDGTRETRTFSTSSRACAPLARALGAWVAVRMDDWSERQRDADAASENPSQRVEAAQSPKPDESVVKASPPVPYEAAPPTAGVDPSYDVDRDGKRIPDPAGPEISVASSLLSGITRNTLVGGSASLGFGVGESVVLRGSLSAYTAAVNPAAVYNHRFEVCRRFPGAYARFRGLALDLCAGGEAGLANGKAYGAVGPTAALHGDLARSIALDLGGGFALPWGGDLPTPEGERGLTVALRGDLGLTWRLP